MIFPNLEQQPEGYYSVNPLPSELELEEHYSTYWQEGSRPITNNYSLEDIDWLNSKYNLYLEMFPKTQNIQTCLDIGTGEGFLLNYLSKRFTVTGIDYSDSACKKFNPKVANKLIIGNLFQVLERFAEMAQTFDLVFLTHVLEHVINPKMLLEKIKNVISPNGLLIISIPNDFSNIHLQLIQKSLLKSSNIIHAPDHLHYFSKDSLVKLVQSSGFYFHDMISDFPREFFLANPSSNYYLDPIVGRDAHRASIFLESFINSNENTLLKLDFYRSLQKLDLGRNLTGVFVNN